MGNDVRDVTDAVKDDQGVAEHKDGVRDADGVAQVALDAWFKVLEAVESNVSHRAA